MKRYFTLRNYVLFGLVLLIALSRLINNYYNIPNFTPVMAIGLFGAAYFADNKKIAFMLPLLAMFISDLFLGFHPTMIAVYLSLVLGVILGSITLRKITVSRIILSTLASSVLFFVITNFAVWLSGWYPMNYNGLINCYTMAIPFFRNSLFGDLFYSGVLFGAFRLAEIFIPSIQIIKIK